MKRLTVMDWAVKASGKIPVKVRRGTDTIATAKSLEDLTGHGMPGILESALRSVTITPELITIYVK